MRSFLKHRQVRHWVILAIILASVGPAWGGYGLPEWGASTGPVAFLIRVTDVRSPPLYRSVPTTHYHWWGPTTTSPDVSIWLEGYEVSLTNVTRMSFSHPLIQYDVYEMDPDGGVELVHGNNELNDIPVNGCITLITNQVLMKRVVQGNQPNISPGKLLGIRVRIFNRQNILIQDYAAPWDLLYWRNWNYPLYTQGGGLIKPPHPGVPLGG